MNKVNLITREIKSRLPLVFPKSLIKDEAEKIQHDLGFSDSTLYRVLNKAKKIPVKWSRDPSFRLFSFEKDPDALEVVMGLCQKNTSYYASHLLALYWNELMNQRPSTYFITKELNTNPAHHTKSYNKDLVKRAFMKSHRHTNYCITYKKSKIYVIEKGKSDFVGVESKKIETKNGRSEFLITGIERTLIDSIISPQYSGGIINVINCFINTKLNLRDLYNIYTKFETFYPYWQVIGFILEKTKSERIGDDWDSNFSESKKVFFLDRNYRSDWLFSDKWQIYYPQGIFND